SKWVLYWMQAAQRTRCNHALEFAIERANELSLPVVCCFGLTDDYPEANARHYAFMLQGLRDVDKNLSDRGIAFVCDKGSPSDVAVKWSEDAAEVVVDMGYLRPCRKWRDEAADALDVRLTQVETGVVVPVEEVSDKREYAARTIRTKLHKKWDDYFVGLDERKVKHVCDGRLASGELDVSKPETLLESLRVDCDVPPSSHFEGGEDEAKRRLDAFLKDKLDGYADGRNEPSADKHSHMSMYLHFGQIAALEVALAVKQTKANDDTDSYLEELIVRRELGKNYVWFEPEYDSYDALPDWAKKTLDEHRDDDRPSRYTRDELEQAETHDPYWNAAMRQLRKTGFMHNYMRMYWGKKVLEWCNTPEYAYETLLYLNNRWLIDGRDPNSYSNVAWVFGLHDRPWTERSIFGKIRYMNDKGLERKFDMQAYIRQVDALDG
ncbi:MAG: deoxyribodipyrimidine photo-lyase, partial [Planctomycetota bacterium]